jgi:hypothetical protein
VVDILELLQASRRICAVRMELCEEARRQMQRAAECLARSEQRLSRSAEILQRASRCVDRPILQRSSATFQRSMTLPERQARPVLQRLTILCGGEKALCVKLGTASAELRRWLAGASVPDARSFDAMVALLIIEEARAARRAPRNRPAEKPHA